MLSLKKLVVLLCLLNVFVVGCSAENLSEDRAENMPESAENAGLAEEAAYIELAHMENYANFYELTFHKREVNTGGRLFFQGTQKDSDEFLLPEETGLYGWKFENADGTEAEPAGDSVDQIYWYDRDTGLADAETDSAGSGTPSAGVGQDRVCGYLPGCVRGGTFGDQHFSKGGFVSVIGQGGTYEVPAEDGL